jgi:hypothetical protein
MPDQCRLILLALSIRNLSVALRDGKVTGPQAAPYLADYAAEICQGTRPSPAGGKN